MIMETSIKFHIFFLPQFNEKEKKDAGMAIPPTVKDERKKVVEGQILLNNLIMPHVTRKERIETLLVR